MLGGLGRGGKREALANARMEKIPEWALEACHLETCRVMPKEEVRAVALGDGNTRGWRVGHAQLCDKPVGLFDSLACVHE